jgi:hypothetical protein
MSDASQEEGRRFILFHKQGTSARTRFLCFANKSVLYPGPLPELSQPYDETLPQPPESVIEPHPSMLLQQLAQGLAIEPGQLELEPEYEERVDIPSEIVRVYLVRFTSIDPPFELAEKWSAAFHDLPQLRHMSDTELRLLRRAYEVIMEG